MSIEKKIDDLIAALDRNTAAHLGDVMKPAAKAPTKPAPAAPVAKAAAPAAAEGPTADQVKAKITEVVKALGTDVGKRLLDETHPGAKKFPDLDVADYATFIEKADAALAEASQP